MRPSPSCKEKLRGETVTVGGGEPPQDRNGTPDGHNDGDNESLSPHRRQYQQGDEAPLNLGEY